MGFRSIIKGRYLSTWEICNFCYVLTVCTWDWFPLLYWPWFFIIFWLLQEFAYNYRYTWAVCDVSLIFLFGWWSHSCLLPFWPVWNEWVFNVYKIKLLCDYVNVVNYFQNRSIFLFLSFWINGNRKSIDLFSNWGSNENEGLTLLKTMKSQVKAPRTTKTVSKITTKA